MSHRGPRVGATAHILYAGETVSAVPGETIAATLLAAGHPAQGTARDGAPRGVFCGMGVCHDCVVIADRKAGTRACLAKVRDGMMVEPQPYRLDASDPGLVDLARPPGDIPTRGIDVLIVGAGPAGLTAAIGARTAGASVLLIDERASAGGQYFKQPSGAIRKPDRQARSGADLVTKALALGVEMLPDTMVWGAARTPDGGLEIGCLEGGRAQSVRPRMLIVATGAIEAPPFVPGWTLPGVMTTGAVQALVRSSGTVPRGRILVAGNGPLNIQTACELLDAGAEVIGLAEAAPAPWTRPRRALALLRAGPLLAARGQAQLGRLVAAGVAIHWAHRVIRMLGETRVRGTVLAPVGRDGPVREVAADVVAVGEGFLPADELPRLLGCAVDADRDGRSNLMRDDSGATAAQDIFVAGEAGGFGGAGIALARGTLAGREAARRLGYPARGDDRTPRRDLSRSRAFQTALWSLFEAPRPALSRADADTIICRCEAIRLGTLKTLIETHGIEDTGALKRLSRAGMGRCQARYCGPALRELVTRSGPLAPALAPQMPIRPVPIAALAVDRPEWDGHRRVPLPKHGAPAGLMPLEPAMADIVIVGAGIVGLCTALYLARAGQEVVVLERGQPHAQASGGNAGSLHAQLLSFDYGARAAAGGTPAARTLPLQRDSIALWRDLKHELGADFEISITGGLMVAETERDLAMLDQKTATERRQGIDCHVIGPADLARLEPALAEGFLGAAYCPQEGKINPLTAGEAILAAAVAAGARIERRTDVRAIESGPSGFRVATSRGPIRAGRIVNAAGAFASVIGDMTGCRVPVHGAPLQMIVTEAAAPLVSGLLAHAARHLTLKQAANGNLLIGGGWSAGLDPMHGHPRPLASSLEGNLWIAQHVVPALRKLRVLRSWAAMNIDIDGAPILGEHPGRPGVFTAVTSNGYTLGPLMGRVTAQLLLHGEADRDVSAFGLSRFDGGPA